MTDDLSAKLSGILSDPEAMKEIAALASQLGVESPGVHTEGGTPPSPNNGGSLDLQGLLRSLNADGTAKKPDDNAAAQLMSLAPALSALKQEDDTTRLLDAMRPFLSEERQRKLDKAKRLIKVMQLMPLIKDLPLFDL